ncbi:MAG TPA: hypothetical protein VKQ30_19330, partial [Ktedonobacterales bacterium]|nr:hypothetical protein [Ktedonobacterales bacterium]
MQQSNDVGGAWRRLDRAWQKLKEHFGVGALVGLAIAFMLLAAAIVALLAGLNAAITELTGQNIALNLFHWLAAHDSDLLSPLTTPLWLMAALALLALVLAVTTAILGVRFRTSRRDNKRAAEDAYEWQARARRDTQKKDVLGRTLERVEQTGFAIVKAMEQVMDDEYAIKRVLLDRSLSDAEIVHRVSKLVVMGGHEIEAVLNDPTLNDARKAYRLASLDHRIEGVLNRQLEAAIIHALYLVGEKDDQDLTELASDTRFKRGSILVPVSP